MAMARYNTKVHGNAWDAQELIANQPAEFKNFVQRADRELSSLFKAIDKDGNGKLDMDELKAAFKTAGLTVSSKKLDCFFEDMDINKDGYISYEEWR